jgi:hypothetical protein
VEIGCRGGQGSPRAVAPTGRQAFHEEVWGSEGTAPSFLTSALEGEWSASRTGNFTPEEGARGIH